jgi:hypothetical protein
MLSFPMLLNLHQTKRRHSFLLGVVAILLLGGCSREVTKDSNLDGEPVLSRPYRQGSVLAILSVSQTNLASTGQIRLILDVQTPAETEVIFPEIGSQIKSFSVSESYSEPLQPLPNGKILHRRVWKLVPELPGKVIFQPLEIAAGSALIHTDPLSITVRSILPEGIDCFEIKDITAPAPLLYGQQKSHRLGWILGGIGGGLVLAIFFVTRTRRPQKSSERSPSEAAFQALENLPEDALNRIHRLSEILLAFLGGRFQLPTLGKTVNEIMPLLPKTILLGRRHKLEAFLSEAEQIRFSNRVPPGFAADYEAYVHDFVDEMKEEEAPCD